MPVLQVRLNDEDSAKMKEVASAAGVSVSEQIRQWIHGNTVPAYEAKPTNPPPKTQELIDENGRLQEEVKRLKIALASQSKLRPQTRTINEPRLVGGIDPNDPLARQQPSFGSPRPAPKPVAKR